MSTGSVESLGVRCFVPIDVNLFDDSPIARVGQGRGEVTRLFDGEDWRSNFDDALNSLVG
jgi:hypothetical protein